MGKDINEGVGWVIKRGSPCCTNSLSVNNSFRSVVIRCVYLERGISPRFISFSVLSLSNVLAAKPFASIFSE